MIADMTTTIVEQVRSHKEAVAAKHDFDIAKIIAAARERQEASGRRVIRQSERSVQEQPGIRPALK